MPHRRDASDGKTGGGTDECRVGAPQRLLCDLAGANGIDLPPASRDEQYRRAAAFTGKDDGFGNLVKLAPRLARSVLRGAGFARHFHHLGLYTCGGKRGFYTIQALAHVIVVAGRGMRRKPFRRRTRLASFGA